MPAYEITLDVMGEISKLIKLSSKRDAVFQKLKADLAPETPGFRVYTLPNLDGQCVLHLSNVF